LRVSRAQSTAAPSTRPAANTRQIYAPPPTTNPYAGAAGTNPSATPAAAPPLKPEELEQIVAPIALYPDSLLAQMFMASTYPLEIVQAERWQKQNASLKDKALADALNKQPWDPSVKSLIDFPQVLTMMSERLDWTQKLGDAFIADQKSVMDAVQRLRTKAQASGNLKSTNEQKVNVETTTATATQPSAQVIVIESSSPDVVYVPSYNPTVVYGGWPYPSYPPYSYYPPGYVAGTALVSFGVGVAVGAAWGHAWGNCNWGGGDVDIDVNRNYNRNTSINRNDISNRTSNRTGQAAATRSSTIQRIAGAWRIATPGPPSSSAATAPAGRRLSREMRTAVAPRQGAPTPVNSADRTLAATPRPAAPAIPREREAAGSAAWTPGTPAPGPPAIAVSPAVRAARPVAAAGAAVVAPAAAAAARAVVVADAAAGAGDDGNLILSGDHT
jgi:hypothetical protein